MSNNSTPLTLRITAITAIIRRVLSTKGSNLFGIAFQNSEIASDPIMISKDNQIEDTIGGWHSCP